MFLLASLRYGKASFCIADFSSSMCDPAAVSVSSIPTTKKKFVLPWYIKLMLDISGKGVRVTMHITWPMALITNTVSLITFARMYRAKQQVLVTIVNVRLSAMF